MFFIAFRAINKTVKSQSVESATAEERLLSMGFVTRKTKEFSNARERAEVCCGVIPLPVKCLSCARLYCIVYITFICAKMICALAMQPEEA